MRFGARPLKRAIQPRKLSGLLAPLATKFLAGDFKPFSANDGELSFAKK
jgi:hypothetical protein